MKLCGSSLEGCPHTGKCMRVGERLRIVQVGKSSNKSYSKLMP